MFTRPAILLTAAIALPTAAADDPKKPLFPRRKVEAEKKAFNDSPSAEQLAFFEKKIRPALIDHCGKCHSAEADKTKGGLALDTREGVRAGGDGGPVIVPGDPARSLLIQALKSKDESKRMPPKSPLPESVIADFETWVKMGAPDPRVGAKLAPKEIDIAAGRQFWAFQPPKDTPAPTPKAAGWAANDIDRHLLAALEAKGLKPVADADPYTLCRRLYLDLTGLPPTPKEVEAFVQSATRNPQSAIEKLADDLLASPAFGERWGRHWLDVARYAESTGKAINFHYPHAWRYRDYVINAFNADTPFDRFAAEQLAGDLLPAKDDAERARNAVATGFLALGTKTLNERNRRQFEADLIDEQIDAFSQAFLGVTAACARCHDHKFDPIPTRDYYALAGIFKSTETCYGTINLVQGLHPSPLVKLPADAPAGTPPMPAREREELEKRLKSLKGEMSDLSKRNAADAFLSANGIRLRVQTGMLQAKLDLYEPDGTPKKQAMGVRERTRPANAPVLARGEVEKPGEVVPRGVLQVVGSQPTITAGSGRKELAAWVAAADNPLTARVYVNRVWLHLFGRGLVNTPDNFGSTGAAPSHPALLDHLAVWFTTHGWSTKQLVKYVVTTHAYRLSSASDEANRTADPDNALVWRMTPGRLDAEVIRDSLLSVSGILDRTPPQGSPVARSGDGYAQAAMRPGSPFASRTPADETHRSVYLPIVRDSVPEALSLFDAADPSLVTGDRANTTVPSQALFLMNNPLVLKAADAAAGRLLSAATTDAERVRVAYLAFFGRPATAAEVEAAESFVARYAGGKKSKRETWAAVAQAMFGSAEFLMRN